MGSYWARQVRQKKKKKDARQFCIRYVKNTSVRILSGGLVSDECRWVFVFTLSSQEKVKMEGNRRPSIRCLSWSLFKLSLGERQSEVHPKMVAGQSHDTRRQIPIRTHMHTHMENFMCTFWCKHRENVQKEGQEVSNLKLYSSEVYPHLDEEKKSSQCLTFLNLVQPHKTSERVITISKSTSSHEKWPKKIYTQSYNSCLRSDISDPWKKKVFLGGGDLKLSISLTSNLDYIWLILTLTKRKSSEFGASSESNKRFMQVMTILMHILLHFTLSFLRSTVSGATGLE